MPCLFFRFRGRGAAGLMSESWLANGGRGTGLVVSLDLGQLTSLEMASPLTARSQSAPGVICTKTLTTAIPFPLCLHLNSEPGEKDLGKDRKLRREQQQSLTAITTDAEPDLLTGALPPAQFAHSFGLPPD